MKDFIVKEFGKIISKACERFGKEAGCEKYSIQVVFRIGENDELEYVLLKDYEEYKTVEFLEILGVRIDFKGYSMMVPGFITNLIGSYSESMDKPIKSIRIMSIIAKNTDEVLNLLYHRDKFIEKINLEEIL